MAEKTNNSSGETDYLVLGGGCFWCVEAVYQRISGVVSVESGYAGGSVDNPTYEQVCSGRTGHAEVVKVTFRPSETGIDTILDLFFRAHDPTTLNRQGADVGTQYRSIILCNSEEQESAAEAAVRRAQTAYSDPIVTEVKPLERFWPAEAYHRDYFDRNRNAGYCRIVIQPKLEKLDLGPRKV